MPTITEDFVSFETAKLLKEKNCPDFGYSCICDSEGNKAQTQSIIMKWLREVHNIHISVYVFNRELPITNVPIFYTCDIATKKLSSQQGHLRGIWNTYEQACEAAIRYCLGHLI